MARRIQAISRHLQQQQLFQSDEGRKIRLHSFTAGPHLVEYDGDSGGLHPTIAQEVLTEGALTFLAQLVHHFQGDVFELYKRRAEVQAQVEAGTYSFDFLPETANIREGAWEVERIPPVLLDRRVDVGDVSPDDARALVSALNSGAQGIQCDFDDGFCPTWRNVLLGIHNISRASRGALSYPDPATTQAIGIGATPGVMMLRPRAWCMTEMHLHVNGRAVPGPLVDFGLLIYHCGAELEMRGMGPFFYCSKMEHYLEARLWNSIFTWTETRLGLKKNGIKACVLIENITASFQMDEILHELRDHSAGLNCGIWDYSASFIARFAQRSDMVFPDRTKYVNMSCGFMRSYMRLLVDTCHRRGALATTGMAGLVLDPAWDSRTREAKMEAVRDAKRFEAKEGGADGALIYDLSLRPLVAGVFDDVLGPERVNQRDRPLDPVPIRPADLLEVPPGGITQEGVRFNVAIGLRFIESWLRGRGSFVYRNAAEDSATAEISRSQIWQWVRHGLRTEDGVAVTLGLVMDYAEQTARELGEEGRAADIPAALVDDRVAAAIRIYRVLVSAPSFPRFITTFLYEQALFQELVRHRLPVSN